MVYQGKVISGRVELDSDVHLPEGAIVQVEVPEQASPRAEGSTWQAQSRRLAERIDEAWVSSHSIVDLLIESRR